MVTPNKSDTSEERHYVSNREPPRKLRPHSPVAIGSVLFLHLPVTLNISVQRQLFVIARRCSADRTGTYLTHRPTSCSLCLNTQLPPRPSCDCARRSCSIEHVGTLAMVVCQVCPHCLGLVLPVRPRRSGHDRPLRRSSRKEHGRAGRRQHHRLGLASLEPALWTTPVVRRHIQRTSNVQRDE